ncbi:hypothetical protein HPB51_027550 [Rhipicephalus microplus]|uniref:HTH CENPB-type domain-containing protein n=1 Tax=Rhipicephalus microplus TaxID=6941 RepID=A0A9J6CZS6_RHIMP|nr:hypothetical protein HPB51_027550 [Rhipicephalus microplus]
MLRVKALALARAKNIPAGTFKASAGWVRRFLKRKDLSFWRRTTLCQRLPEDYTDKASKKTEEKERTGATPDVYDYTVVTPAKHFDTTCNLVVERHRFQHRIHSPGESIQEYMTALTELAARCSFTLQEESLCD